MTETPFDEARARFNMIEQQVRPWEVLDPRTLDVLAQTPREDFVPQHYRKLAFADVRIPLGHGEVMMTPNVEGRLLQALDVHPSDHVLEVGTGSGYLTACLTRLARQATSVDIYPEFTQAARRKLVAHGLQNVTLRVEDVANGWDVDQKFDVIAVTGSLPVLHHGFHVLLSMGGRLFVIVGTPPIMEALLITRMSKCQWATESLFDTELPPLVNARRPKRFEF
jgi:Protein-L-isoaspartate carboxylmethyltransferase